MDIELTLTARGEAGARAAPAALRRAVGGRGPGGERGRGRTWTRDQGATANNP